MSYHKEKIAGEGFAVVDDVYTQAETDAILHAIVEADVSGPAFRKSEDLFAIRQFLKEVPGVYDLLFTARLRALIAQLIGKGYFVVKSIYFDKPAGSNWFVSYHQDLTISVDRKAEADGFGLWTIKQGWFAVQPPLPILESNYTMRIHLDDTDEANGALKVIPGSHRKGIYRPETIGRAIETEAVSSVQRGVVMILKPFLLHSSGRTMNNNRRRVVHIEFSRHALPNGLQWAELMEEKSMW